MRSLALLIVSLLAVAAVAFAQQPAPAAQPQPRPTMPGAPRDNQPQEKTGTARLTGRVMAADTGKPLRRAIVRAMSPDTPQGKSVSTDADGRWELKALPAGSYRLRIEKGGYVAFFYGQQRPFAQGKVLEVAEGQVVEKLDVSLPRAGVITGIVMDEFGDPMNGSRVLAMRYGYLNGQRRLTPVGSSDITDDIGQYRLHGLTPGEYYVSASMTSSVMFGPSDDRTGYASTFYPGTASQGEARRVTVVEGQESQQITFNMASTRVAVISGTATSASGKPISRGYASLVPMTEFGGQMGFGAQLKPDGAFSFSSVAPGEYRVLVQYAPTNDQTLIAGGGLNLVEYASASVSVGGRDVTGLALVTAPGAIARGRIVFEGGAPPSASPATTNLFAVPVNQTPGMMGGGGTRVRDDWTFETSGLFDRRRFRMVNPPTGWFVKSVTHESTDITDTGLEVAEGQTVSDIVILLTQRVTNLTGAVQDSRARPVTDYAVVAFSPDSTKWGYQTRYVATARPNQEGRFSIKALPPGEYLVIALDYLESGEEGDPEQLEKWKALATRITISDGEAKTVDLKLGG